MEWEFISSIFGCAQYIGSGQVETRRTGLQTMLIFQRRTELTAKQIDEVCS